MSLSADIDYNELFNVYRSFGVDVNVKCRFSDGIIEIGDNKYKVELSSDMNEARARKHALYAVLSDYTGKTLPWGSLTGIRPTKLAYELLQQGKIIDSLSDYGVSAEKIAVLKDIIASQKGLSPSFDKINFYVHVPFCSSRCNYCSFVSMPVNKKTLPLMQKYTELLALEIKSGLKLLNEQGYTVDSIYVGGGTPTALSAEQLQVILEPLSNLNVEFTVEAGRPDTITEQKLKVMKDASVTRISINPQTFSDKTLSLIGRNHTCEDIIRVYDMAKDDFDINMDLIAGLTGENIKDFSYSIDRTIELMPQNVTVHTLSKKNGSSLKNNNEAVGLDVPEMVELAKNRLMKAGYKPYYLYRQKNMLDNMENIGYTLNGKICKNNVTTMEEFYSVFACGAGAISKKITNDGIYRLANLRDVILYVEQFRERLAKKEKFFLRSR